MNSDSQREKKDGKKKEKGSSCSFSARRRSCRRRQRCAAFVSAPSAQRGLKNNILLCFPYVTSSQQTPGIVLQRRPPLLLHFLDVCCLRSEPQGPKRPFVVRPRGKKNPTTEDWLQLRCAMMLLDLSLERDRMNSPFFTVKPIRLLLHQCSQLLTADG